jgi:hypothetical protein
VVERSITRATGSATKLALEVAALNAAFLYMIETSMKAAVMLRSFALSTGLSTDELQEWQHAAVVNGLAANDLTEAIKELQTQRAQFSLGNPQAVGAWTLLGVDPRQDPFVVLSKLRDRLKDVRDVGVARNLLGQVGMEQLLPLLRSTNLEWEKWSRNFIVTAEQTQKLAALNAAWQSLKMSVASLATQFSSLFVPVLGVVARGLQVVAQELAIFVRWLGSSDPLAHALRLALQVLAAALLALGIILTGIIALLGTLSAVLAILAGGVAGLLITLAPFLIVLGLIGLAVGGLILLFNDFWVAVHGGKSLFDWSKEIWMVNKLADGIEAVIDNYQKLKSIFSLSSAGPGLPGLLLPLLASHILPSGSAGSSSVHQDIHNEVNVHESTSPRATGREVMHSLQDLHRATLNQAPAKNY